MKKYNILQMGYPTVEDWKNHNAGTIQFKERGYAMVEDNEGQEKVWDLCNWSCYADAKPENLHSELTHCNSDIVVWVEGSGEYWVAEPAGWKKFQTLEEAKRHMLAKSRYEAWPLR